MVFILKMEELIEVLSMEYVFIIVTMDFIKGLIRDIKAIA